MCDQRVHDAVDPQALIGREGVAMVTICVLAFYGALSFGPPEKAYHVTTSEAACERLKTKLGASWAVSNTTEINSAAYKRVCGDNGQDCIVTR